MNNPTEVVRLATRAFRRYWKWGWKEPELLIMAEIVGAVVYSYQDGVFIHDIATGKELIVKRPK